MNNIIKVIADIVIPVCIGFAIGRGAIRKKWRREAEEYIKHQKEISSDDVNNYE